MVAHPPCTYLSNAGVRHLHSVPSRNGVLAKIHGPERWEAMRESAAFFLALLNAPIPRVAVENPRMHKYAKALVGPYSQVIHPHEHGHGETKATCLWLRGLPSLMSTAMVTGRYPMCHKTPPSADRWKIRSRTYQGIADAMAEQWGGPHAHVQRDSYATPPDCGANE
jgi:hypothetical protein